MDALAMQANPVADNSQAQAVTEGSTGDFLDGLKSDSGDGGKNTAGEANLSQGNVAGKDQAAAQSQAPLASKDEQSVKPAWMKQLKADLQTHDGLSRFSDISELGKSYLELEGKLGKSIAMPDKDAPKEQWDEFYLKVGRPKNPESYVLEKPKDLPRGITYSEESEKNFRKMAFDMNLTQAQATANYNALMNTAISAVKTQDTQRIAHAKDCEETLRAEYGNKYNANMENARRFLSIHGGKNVLAKLQERGLGSDPDIIRMLVSAGAELREDSLVGSNSSVPPKEDKKGFDYSGI